MEQKYINLRQLGQLCGSFTKIFEIEPVNFKESSSKNSVGFESFAFNARNALSVAAGSETGTGRFDLNKSNPMLNAFVYSYNKMEEITKFQLDVFYDAIQHQQQTIKEAKQAGCGPAVIEFNKDGLAKAKERYKYFQTMLTKFEKFDAEFEKITGTSLPQLRKSAKKHTKEKEHQEVATV